MRHITLITTGGTIEKTYDEMTGELTNRMSVVRRMLEQLRLEETRISIVELMQKDSLHMTDDDRAAIVAAVRGTGVPPVDLSGHRTSQDHPHTQDTGKMPVPPPHPHRTDAIVILHGTDTLTTTGERLLKDLPGIKTPIVLTGAMRPFEMIRSDALQNLTEAIFAAGMLSDAGTSGVYCAAHGRVLKFPGVKKDRERGTFVAGH
jgi:L-asparaginase